MSGTEQHQPAWLIAAVDQRVAMLNHKLGNVALVIPAMALVATPLTEPREGCTREEYERWDRSCDNCGKYCGEGVDFFTGHMTRTLKDGKTQALIHFGACRDCAEK